MPYHTIPNYNILYHTIPYHTILHHIIPYYTIPYYTIPYYAIPYQTKPNQPKPIRTIVLILLLRVNDDMIFIALLELYFMFHTSSSYFFHNKNLLLYVSYLFTIFTIEFYGNIILHQLSNEQTDK